MHIMLEAIENLLKVYRSIEPLSSLWAFACQRRRVAVKGPDNWAAVRDTIAGDDVKGALFDISSDHAPSQPLRL